MAIRGTRCARCGLAISLIGQIACGSPLRAGPVLPALIIVISAMAAVVANPPHGIHSDQTTPLP